MSTSKTINKVKSSTDCWVVTWESLAANETGDANEMPGSSDRSVTISGTLSGATVIVEGSNNGTDYFTLTDPQGNPISFTSTKLKAISEITAFTRPRINGGDGLTNVRIDICIKGQTF